MVRRKIILLFIFAGLLPVSASGSADFDNSLTVDLNDLSLWTDYWLYDYNDNERCAFWDLNSNGQIDIYDLDAIANYWLSPYDFEDFADFGQYWRRTVDYRFQDKRFDLSGDGRVDLKDFSAFAVDWKTTINCCDDLNSPDPRVFENWQEFVFSGIGPCGIYDCWFGEDESDPCYDGCGKRAYVACQETPEFDYYCAYNFWHDNTRVGICVYDCGMNYFYLLKNNAGCRITATRHITRDRPPQDPYCNPPYPSCNEACDEQTIDYYNWQIVFTAVVNGQKAGWCRQGYEFDPRSNSAGNEGPCKIIWW